MERDRKEIAKTVAASIAIVLFFVIAQIIVGCSPRLVPPAEIRDSVRVEIRERLIHDSVYVEIEKQVEVNATMDSTSHLENDYAESDAAIINGILHHSLSSRPQRIYVPYTVTVHDTTVVEKQAQTIIKEVERQFTKWQSFSMVLGWILGAICLLAIIATILVKKFLK